MLNITFKYGPIEFEAVCESEEDRRAVIKAINRSLADLKLPQQPQPQKEAPTAMPVDPVEEYTAPTEERRVVGSESLAEGIPAQAVPADPNDPNKNKVTEKQLAYMEKLGIDVPENCTKIQAADMIREFKRQKGWKVN